jgi:hypothetical protein
MHQLQLCGLSVGWARDCQKVLELLQRCRFTAGWYACCAPFRSAGALTARALLLFICCAGYVCRGY